MLGRTDEATREIERAVELDPQSLIINTERGAPYAQARQCGRALPLFRKALEMDPESPATLYYLARCSQQEKRFDEAIALYRRLMPTSGAGSPVVTGSLAHAYAVAGRRQDSERLLQEMLAASRQACRLELHDRHGLRGARRRRSRVRVD